MLHTFPPVGLDDVGVLATVVFHQTPQPQRHNEHGIVFLSQSADGIGIEMVVVVVGKQADINLRQLFPCNARGAVALWAESLHRAGVVAPDGVGQEVEPCRADKHGGVVHHGDFPVLTVHLRCQLGLVGQGVYGGIFALGVALAQPL